MAEDGGCARGREGEKRECWVVRSGAGIRENFKFFLTWDPDFDRDVIGGPLVVNGNGALGFQEEGLMTVVEDVGRGAEGERGEGLGKNEHVRRKKMGDWDSNYVESAFFSKTFDRDGSCP